MPLANHSTRALISEKSIFMGREGSRCEERLDFTWPLICFNLSSICNIRLILNGSQITPLTLIASIFLSLSEVIPFIWQNTEWDRQPAKPLCAISTVCSTDLICELSDWWHAQWERVCFFFLRKNAQLETMCHHQSSITCYWSETGAEIFRAPTIWKGQINKDTSWLIFLYRCRAAPIFLSNNFRYSFTPDHSTSSK